MEFHGKVCYHLSQKGTGFPFQEKEWGEIQPACGGTVVRSCARPYFGADKGHCPCVFDGRRCSCAQYGDVFLSEVQKELCAENQPNQGGAYVEKASAKHPHCGATSWCKSRLRSFRRCPRKTSKRSATTMIFTKKGIRLRGNGNTIGGETC